MYLYKKLKRFSPFSALLLKSKSNFERFFFKDDAHTFCISEIIDCKIRGQINV